MCDSALLIAPTVNLTLCFKYKNVGRINAKRAIRQVVGFDLLFAIHAEKAKNAWGSVGAI